MPEEKIFISLNDEYSKGHGADLRFCLNEALGASSCAFFQDKDKVPDNLYSVTIEEILISSGILLDALPFENQINPDILIQFGIAHALGKKSAFLYVRNNSAGVPPISSHLINSYRIGDFDNYLDVIIELKTRLQEMIDQDIPRQKIESNKMSVQSFSVFGGDEEKDLDLVNVISSFAMKAGWEAKFQINFIYGYETPSLLDDLSIFIGLRPFSVFCLNKDVCVETYIGIGLAIGMGVPFLILQDKEFKLPASLGGYHGIIEYNNSEELATGLSKYTKEFLSEDVNSWNGSTFSHLLLRTDKIIPLAKAEADLNRIEKILHAINRSIRLKTPLLYALLGEVARERYRRFDSKNPKYLELAREYYNEALKIDADYKRAQDAIASLNEHLRLIDLVEKKSYKSIPSLIRLIGEDINTSQYQLLREYLIGEVRKLIDAKNYSQALALLAAIETHDKTSEIKELIKQVLSAASPNDIAEVLRSAQDQIELLERNQSQMSNELDSKNKQLSEVSQHIQFLREQVSATHNNLAQQATVNLSELLMINEAKESLLIQLRFTDERLSAEMEKVSELESERDDLEREREHFEKELFWKDRWLDKLRDQRNSVQAELLVANERIRTLEREKELLERKFDDNLGQLQIIQKAKQDLEKIVMNDTQQALNKSDMQRQLDGEVALVDFGLGWALYFTLREKPYIDRQGQKISARKGLVIEFGDKITYEDGIGGWIIRRM